MLKEITVCHTSVIFGKSILRFHAALFMSTWIRFDCGLTKWHHNSLDSDRLALCSSEPMCVFLLINTRSVKVINWAECEIWQAWVELCGLPLHSNTTQTCWHERQMSEGVWREPSTIYHLDASGLGRQTAHSINNLASWHCWYSFSRSRLLSIKLKCQANITCRAIVWGGGGLRLVCVFNKSGWSWVVKPKSVFKLRFQLVTLRVILLDWMLFIWTSYTHTHKWPLGAVFDKQTDWIACVNACGFSPRCPRGPFRIGRFTLKDMEISARNVSLHTCVCAHTYSIHLTIQTRT